MAKQYWLVKQEPESYSWESFQRDGRTVWEGVRNYQARNNLNAMRPGDPVLYYHSGGAREAVGIAEVLRPAFPDPTSTDPSWVAVELKALRPLKRPVPLADIKAHPALKDMALVRQSRLSVVPVTAAEFKTIVDLSRTREEEAKG